LKSPNIGNSLSASIPAVCARAVKVAMRLEWIARRQMAKWRHQALAAVPANGAEDVSRLVSHGVRTFDERKIAGCGGAQQCVEVGACVVRNLRNEKSPARLSGSLEGGDGQ
jgi:hypothetical protein